MTRLEMLRNRIMEEEKNNSQLYSIFLSDTSNLEVLKETHRRIIISNAKLKLYREEETLLIEWGE